MKVNFLDLSLINRQVKTSFLKAAKKILENSHFVLSEEVSEFEKQWAETIGVKYAIGVSCGADALYLSLVSLGIGAGDEVITQGNAYNASVTAILRVGAIPRFVDVDQSTLEMDVSKLEALITEKTKAILPVHLYGQVNQMDKIMEIARRHNLEVIEDCAQAHLAEFNGKKAGSFGTVNAFSFYPTKNLGAFGDAGAVTTESEKLFKKIIKMRNLGQKTKNDHQLLGYNMRLDPLQAAALSLKLPYLAEWTNIRRQAAKYYQEFINGLGIKIKYQKNLAGAVHVYHLFVVLLPKGVDRAKIQKKLLKRGVETAVHYPMPVYKQPFYQGSGTVCPNTENACGRILSLPFFVGIKQEEQGYVIRSLKEVLENGK